MLALLVLALCLRARDFRAPFDREFEGYQGAFFAIGAVNFERLGPARTLGYPVLNVDLGPRGDPARDLRDAPHAWFVYPNHPPAVPLLAWAAVRAGAGGGWTAPCERGEPPRGIEPWIRAPFLAASLAWLAALWWAVREAAGARKALLALAIAAVLPVAVVYGTLVNYENPILAAILLAAAGSARWLRGGGARDLALGALGFATASAISYAGVFFVPPLALLAWARRGARGAARFALVAGAAALAPLLLQAAWSARALAGLGRAAEPALARVAELWAPLRDGSHPLQEWLRLQLERTLAWFTAPVAIAAAAGLVLAIAAGIAGVRARRRGTGAAPVPPGASPVALGPALLAGGALYLLAFYKHTLDPQHTFLLLLAPGLACLAADALDLALRQLPEGARRTGAGGVAWLALALACHVRADELRHAFRAGPGDAHAGRAAPPLPLPDATGRELATLVPPGGFGIHPACVGLTPAAAFYAWRSLYDADDPADTLPRAVARYVGLGAAPHVLLLPKHPWPSIAGQIAAFERDWVAGAPPDRESAHWRAWDLH